MRYLKTENCVICGNKAKYWHGHVIGMDKFALGCAPVKVVAGFCEEHMDCENGDENGCYGDYNSSKMGKCVPLFRKGELK